MLKAASLSTLVVASFLAACGGGDDPGTGGASTTGGSSGATTTATTGSNGWVQGAHPPLPQVINLGGPVLASPKVRPIMYQSDGHAADIQAFLAELASTSYWGQTTSEYGVGPLTVLPLVTRPEAAPATVTTNALSSALSANTGVGAPWGDTDADTIYLFILPEGTTIDAEGPCCLDFDGFHDETNVNGVDVPYAVVCSCPGFDGPSITDLQQITVAVSHELVEAATDPHVWTAPAFVQAENDALIWTLITGGEVADMCTFDPDAYMIPQGSKYMVQRSWSNAAALVGADPCRPPMPFSFVAAMPVMPDKLGFSGVPFLGDGVKIPVGEKRTIDVQLWSDGPTSGPFSVTAVDYNAYFGGKANLGLTLDKTSGQNGDVLKLEIESLSIDPSLPGAAFFLVSQQGYTTSLTIGAVGK